VERIESHTNLENLFRILGPTGEIEERPQQLIGLQASSEFYGFSKELFRAAGLLQNEKAEAALPQSPFGGQRRTVGNLGQTIDRLRSRLLGRQPVILGESLCHEQSRLPVLRMQPQVAGQTLAGLRPQLVGNQLLC
jgi:hypothetical protein